MKRFSINSKKWGKCIVIVDDVDAYLLRSYVWTVSGSNTPVIARNHGTGGKETMLLSHMLMTPDSGTFVRHINGNQLDNRRSNLAVIPHKQKETA